MSAVMGLSNHDIVLVGVVAKRAITEKPKNNPPRSSKETKMARTEPACLLCLEEAGSVFGAARADSRGPFSVQGE
ncbi:hypothetical protein FRC20_000487 [Serendipita sp. 405]|nr:hypothetical protein FRC20_000487 [Serendipita sp. 405]